MYVHTHANRHTHLLGCVDDSGVVTKLQWANNGCGNAVEEVAGHLLLGLWTAEDTETPCESGAHTQAPVQTHLGRNYWPQHQSEDFVYRKIMHSHYHVKSEIINISLYIKTLLFPVQPLNIQLIKLNRQEHFGKKKEKPCFWKKPWSPAGTPSWTATHLLETTVWV